MPVEDFEHYTRTELEKHERNLEGVRQEMTVINLEQSAFRIELRENTEATKRIEANTSEMLDVFQSFKGAMKVLEWIGKAAKPLGWVVAMCAAFAAFWTSIKSGVNTK